MTKRTNMPENVLNHYPKRGDLLSIIIRVELKLLKQEYVNKFKKIN